MKIIFLDIDGVLNVIPKEFDKYGGTFHPEFVENLKHIIDKTGAKIVISSSWRSAGLQTIKNMWKDRNLPGEVVGITPYLSNMIEDNIGNIVGFDSVPRGYEIQKFIEKCTFEIDSYVIIDDDTDMLDSQLKNFVQTSENSDHPDCIDIGYGLTKKCAKKAIAILNTIKPSITPSKKMDEFLDKVDALCHEYGYEIHPTIDGWTGRTDKNGNYDTIAIIGKDEIQQVVFIDGDGRGK